jgi:hypothetical protein
VQDNNLSFDTGFAKKNEFSLYLKGKQTRNSGYYPAHPAACDPALPVFFLFPF